ncbi:MGDG synthase family glycosyltransferase [Bacillus sp. Marseille-Q3570]|uniref:MGDG synthase family glycosyltransferase n=1 Tax=Bacillus sp. Marseille-Q3570 TaxID=2963522 RepID=UPI0021B73D60|nr:glycosyltransferase [Bacillus sp. Marseille-Q3570]
MKKVLIMPLLTISSGHHHVADTIRSELDDLFACEKIELLSSIYGKGELAVSQVYLSWIKNGPAFYSNVYKRLANSQKENNFSHKFYQKLFLKSTREIIARKQPDLIICTHALPSYLVNHLKAAGELNIPIVNIYTDYFINNLWGRTAVDLHLVPDEDFREELIQDGVAPQKILTSGIPVNRHITPVARKTHQVKKQYRVLLTGGNQGAGHILDFIKEIPPSGRLHYTVLCGKNYRLLSQVKGLDNKYITTYPYIDSKVEMNDMYEHSDAIITKPGGVTLAESLMKRIPIFINDCLPGQEEYNLNYLKKRGLGYCINVEMNVENQILNNLDDPIYSKELQEQIQLYHQRIETVDYPTLFTELIEQNRKFGHLKLS